MGGYLTKGTTTFIKVSVYDFRNEGNKYENKI